MHVANFSSSCMSPQLCCRMVDRLGLDPHNVGWSRCAVDMCIVIDVFGAKVRVSGDSSPNGKDFSPTRLNLMLFPMEPNPDDDEGVLMSEIMTPKQPISSSMVRRSFFTILQHPKTLETWLESSVSIHRLMWRSHVVRIVGRDAADFPSAKPAVDVAILPMVRKAEWKSEHWAAVRWHSAATSFDFWPYEMSPISKSSRARKVLPSLLLPQKLRLLSIYQSICFSYAADVIPFQKSSCSYRISLPARKCYSIFRDHYWMHWYMPTRVF